MQTEFGLFRQYRHNKDEEEGGIQGGQGGGQHGPHLLGGISYLYFNSSQLQKNYLLLFVLRALIF